MLNRPSISISDLIVILIRSDGLALAAGMGTSERITPTIIGTVHRLFWDGRANSLWAEVLGPLENAVEDAGSRMQYAHSVVNDENY